MEWIVILARIWVGFGAVGFVMGLLYDLIDGKLGRHNADTTLKFLIYCILLGPIALVISCDIMYQKLRDIRKGQHNGKE